MKALTRSEALLASRLMAQAADEFSNHGCNDMPDEMFDGISAEEKRQLLADFNVWNRSGDNPDDQIKYPGDSGWMQFLAARITEVPHA